MVLYRVVAYSNSPEVGFWSRQASRFPNPTHREVGKQGRTLTEVEMLGGRMEHEVRKMIHTLDCLENDPNTRIFIWTARAALWMGIVGGVYSLF